MISAREYNRIHKGRLRNRPKKGVCEFCASVAKTQWSNKSGEYRDYLDDFDWQELCVSCHVIYDKKPRKPTYNIFKQDKQRILESNSWKQSVLSAKRIVGI